MCGVWCVCTCGARVWAGVDALTKLLRKWLDEPSTYKPEEMRACLDSWREVLFGHLDAEVRMRALFACGGLC